MARIKLDKEEEVEKEDAVMRWSVPKVLIALGILALVGMFGVYAYDNFKSSSENLEVKKVEDRAQIKLPTDGDVNKILEEAKTSIGKIDAGDIISSQPEIKKAIENLEKLTTNDKDAKKAVCDTICK